MNKLLGIVESLLDRLLITLFLAMVAAIVWQVVSRYFLGSPTIWSEELARFLVVWVTMLGSAYVLENGGHVAVTIFVDMMPQPWQRFFEWVRDVIVITMAGGLAYYGYGFAASGARRTSTGLGLQMSYAYAAIPIGAALIAFFLIARRMTGPKA